MYYQNASSYPVIRFRIDRFFFAQNVGGGLDQQDCVKPSLKAEVLEPGATGGKNIFC